MINRLFVPLLMIMSFLITGAAFAVDAPSARDTGEDYFMERLNDSLVGWSSFDIHWTDSLNLTIIPKPFQMQVYDFTGVATGNIPTTEQKNAAPQREAWTYCIDHRAFLDPDWYEDYKGRIPTPNVATITTLAWNRKVYLIDKYGRDSIVDNTKAAAMQLSIWELINDTSGTLGIGNGQGTFYVTDGSLSYWTSSVTQANSWLAEVSTLTFPDGYGSWDQAWMSRNTATGKIETGQNLNEVPPVPEPSSLVALSMGLVPLLGLRRRRK